MRSQKRPTVALFSSVVLLLGAAPLRAQDLPASRGPTDPAEIETFVDEQMASLLEEHRVPGAVVSVVAGGEVLLQKGYGYADWEQKTPVQAETTMFRIASVSKLFVWTSVMQLVERGLLDLETDINEYLDYEIPATFADPITLADLMAHAGGLEERYFESSYDPSLVRPLGEVLAAQIPARVRPPGDLSSYSNQNAAIAGYIVELASGVEWSRYADENIFDPLGMEHTTFEQPVPGELSSHLAKGHWYRGGQYIAAVPGYTHIPPAMGVRASGADMARFMAAHLGFGQLAGQKILEEETARLMQSDHHRMDPAVNAMAHGFMVTNKNGERILTHGGGFGTFASILLLLPERSVGLFVSCNSGGGLAVRRAFSQAFLDHYFPATKAPPVLPEDVSAAAERAQRFAGVYRSNRFPPFTPYKFGALTLETPLSVTSRGTLSTGMDEWVEVAPLVYEHESGDGRALVFKADEAGNITQLLRSHQPQDSWERVPLLERKSVHTTLFLFAFTMIVLTLLSPIILWIVRRFSKAPAENVNRIPARARRTNLLAAGMFAVSIVSVTFFLLATGPPLPPSAAIAFWVPLLASIPTTFSIVFAVRVWKRGEGRMVGRLFYSLTSVAFCVLLWQISIWNILPWKL